MMEQGWKVRLIVCSPHDFQRELLVCLVSHVILYSRCKSKDERLVGQSLKVSLLLLLASPMVLAKYSHMSNGWEND